MDQVERIAKLLREVREEHEQGKQLSEPNDKVLIIDGNNNFIRVFSAVPALNDDGVHIGGIIGFLKSIGSMIKQYRPTRCIIVFDGKGGSTRRKKIFPGYKQGRNFKLNVNRLKDLPGYSNEEEAMIAQFRRLIQYLNILPISIISIDNIEADDTIAYLADEKYKDSEIVIASTDKDFFQLLDEKTSIWSPVQKKHITNVDISDKYGIESKNFLLYRVFDGDNSDSIPGINGVGLSTLKKRIPIITEDKKLSTEDIYEYCKTQLADGKTYKIYQSILDSVENIERNWLLMSLKDHNISSSLKLKISNLADQPIPVIDKQAFRKMISVDRMVPAIPNLDHWLNSVFGNLNEYARMTQ